MNTRGLYWFRYDLRLDDNPGFMALSQHCDELLCVYIFDEQDFHNTRFQTQSLGSFRYSFIYDSLVDLDIALKRLGQKLYVLRGRSFELMTRLIEDNEIAKIGVGQHPGYREQSLLKRLCTHFSDKQWLMETHHTLWPFEQVTAILDLKCHDTPNSGRCTFSRFRKKIESAKISLPVEKPTQLPREINQVVLPALPIELIQPIETNAGVYAGGEQAALAQLQDYLFKFKHVLTYKHTRNQLQGWDFSSKLSAWLAQGCVSPRRVVYELRLFEKTVKSNESTYWLFFELLWREYFQWLASTVGKALFRLRGIQDVNPLQTFYPEYYQQWIHGNTESAFVNAFMRQLNQTGWMSNRGRQIVASYFVNELGLDWRYGAAYFEQQLIDYDVASNWGNWQYLAGVGTDPRGKRHFNLEKQAKLYDPDGVFVKAFDVKDFA